MINNTNTGIELLNLGSNNITNNFLRGSSRGIDFYSSTGNIIINNSIWDAGFYFDTLDAIYLYQSKIHNN